MKRIPKAFIAMMIATNMITSCDVRSNNPNDLEPSSVSATTGLDSTSTDAENISKKKSLLMNHIGKHKLTSISAFMGTNTMADYYVENGKWVANGSSTSGGMRDAYDIELTNEDVEKLETMALLISEDLTLTLLCNGKEYFKTPFQEDGMSYFLKKSPKDFISQVPENLNPNTTFIEEYLYLYAKDEIDESEMINLDIAQIFANAVIITYDTKKKVFEMSLFEAKCCNASTYTF